jgi:hypothetical protein
MDDRCVICGDYVPEGRQVCSRCEQVEDTTYRKCPECFGKLRLMDTCEYRTANQNLYCKLYHCSQCHSDWEEVCEDASEAAPLHRKFWG